METTPRYKYCSFDAENSILYHSVSNENCGSEAAFVLSMSYLMTIMENLRPRHIIVKVFKKPDYFELQVKSFMETTFFRLIKDLGIRKVAFYIPEEYFNHHDLVEESNYTSLVKSKVFSNLEDARRWVLCADL